jgi:hypothetical protein
VGRRPNDGGRLRRVAKNSINTFEKHLSTHGSHSA